MTWTPSTISIPVALHVSVPLQAPLLPRSLVQDTSVTATLSDAVPDLSSVVQVESVVVGDGYDMDPLHHFYPRGAPSVCSIASPAAATIVGPGYLRHSYVVRCRP